MIQPYVGSQTPLFNIEEKQMDLISSQERLRRSVLRPSSEEYDDDVVP